MKRPNSPTRLRTAALLIALLAGRADAGPAVPETADDPALEEALAAEERGFDFLLGTGVAADPAEARRWFEQAAAAGRPNARFQLARLYWFGVGVTADTERALGLYRQAADQGVATAQANLGWAYFTGTGVERDYREAHKWLTAAAHQGEGWAIFLLAILYQNGHGVAQDREFGTALVRRAMELHYGPAEYEMALPLLEGPPERRDPELGIHLMEQAASRNTFDAAVVLAREYLTGTNVARDPEKAFEWLSRASDGGHTVAALLQSQLIGRGIGIERNEALALEKRQVLLAEATISEKNSFCWMLSVSPSAEIRNGDLAVAIMEEALADPANRTFAYVDTLAAAYAEAGQFDKAVAAQREAIEASPADAAAELVSGLQERLDLYRQRRAFRVAP